jgi:hypothetical protein
MACRGVHFALTREEEAKLLALPPGDERIEYIQEEIEQRWDEPNLAESDKAWDHIHRVLTGYPPEGGMGFDPERIPLFGTEGQRLAVLGGVSLHPGEDYIVTFVPADKVPLVAAAMAELDETTFNERYHRYCRDVYPEYGEEDREYTWEYYQEVRNFFARAAASGRSVIFSADQ